MQPTHTSSRILLPVKPWFIVVSLLFSLTINLAPLGKVPGVPDWVALAIVFWCVREPHRVGMASAFLLGLVTDVANASLMGEHALAYVLAAYGASTLSRRILWFPFLQQSMHLFPLFLGMHVTIVLVRLVAGAGFPGWAYFLSSLSEVLLWPPITYLLLLPQYQPVDKDKNRPI
ncbi:MAG: rod shape-determining protein MreD [Rhodocyclaceae bacterium]|nr:rod shape-determining protein MreD [Rhodocyclaceae bacterium]